MEKHILLAFALTFLALSSWAQLTDDFSDGDFTNNPTWSGDTGQFAVVDETLQLFDPAASGNSEAGLYLSAPTSTDAATSWSFLIRQDFAPSAGNYARVYLASNSPQLAEGEGYYLRIGGISGADDALELYRQDGNSSSLLLSGTAGAVGTDPNQARVRVSRSPAGEWLLEADYTGGEDFQLEGTATDNTYPISAYFGWVCNYTATRSENFFLDDLSISPLFEDTAPPSLLSAVAESPFSILLQFNEPLGPATANLASNYSISNGQGSPASAEQLSDPAQVRLSLGSALQNGVSYTVSATGIADANGNLSGVLSASFTFFNFEPAGFQDIIVSEFMPDPTPSVGLPEEEFIELYNRSNKAIDLSTLRLSNGGGPVQLPDAPLLPQSYITICSEEVLDDFAQFGPAAGMNSFPALVNGGDDIILTDTQGDVIFAVAYTDGWYRDINRSDGGYSLEIINLEGPYDCPGNWRASDATSGGTPGQPNSVMGSGADEAPPFALQAIPESTMEIRIRFNEVMDASSLAGLEGYAVSPSIPVLSALPQPGNMEVLLVLGEDLQPSQAYTLTLGQSLKDCTGNALAQAELPLGIPSPAVPGDVVINEILFNPASGGSDFVELYNRSDKIIDLTGLMLQNTLKETGDTEGAVGSNLLIFPGNHLVLTEAPEDILSRYAVPAPALLFEADLPGLDDDEGNLTLVLGDITLDAVDYTADWHYPLLDDEDGVSLERISAEAPSQSGGNWHSAASTAGFATPTAPNSQQFEQEAGAEAGLINLPRKRFSPDEDGFEDVLLIEYAADQPGYTLNAWVFDASGREVARLANNELLGSTGTFKWDGVAADGSRARLGIYVLFAEFFTPEGDARREKTAFVLAGQLD